MTPIERYRQDLQREDFVHDPAQELVVKHLQRVYDELLRPMAAVEPKKSAGSGMLSRLFGKRATEEISKPPKGLYVWGGVGRGKTYLVDAFFDCLPETKKKRIHFHRFMQKIHQALSVLKHQSDPLKIVAADFAASTRVLCFDEFFVSDITDAMVLARLLEGLFDNGIVMVATSNIEPDRLYWDGLQRANFLPAIELIKTQMEVVDMEGVVDYRLRALERAEIYHSPLDSEADETLLATFEQIAPEPGREGVSLTIEGREVETRRHSDGIVWFDFPAICDGPRGTADYIEIARCFHTVLISNLPVLDRQLEDQARRFVNLVDEFYDRNVKLVMSGAEPAGRTSTAAASSYSNSNEP